MKSTVVVVAVAVLLLHVLLLWLLFRPARVDTVSPDRPVRTEEEKIENETETVEEAMPGDAPGAMDYSGFVRPSRSLPEEVTRLAEGCRAGLLLDWSNRRILWEKEGEQQVPIASMAKMMTVLLMMEEIEANPDLSLDTEVRVTRQAAAVGGRQVWLDPRETFSLDQLLKIIMMHSANDAAYLVAEFLGGGEVDRFVERMNDRASELGLRRAEFVNPHGLDTREDEPVNRATVRELAWLGARLLQYPRVVEWASTWLSSIREDDPRFDRFDLVSTNRLVRSYRGVTGMKTGYTRLAGFCLTATCERDGRVLIAVVVGCESSDQRNQLVEALFDWGWQQY